MKLKQGNEQEHENGSIIDEKHHASGGYRIRRRHHGQYRHAIWLRAKECFLSFGGFR